MRRQFHRIIGISLFVLGFSSVFTQIYFLREFLTVFNGNEIVIGVVLSSWMFLTGIGAWLGRFFKRIRGRFGFVFLLQIVMSVLPILTVVKIDLWRSIVFPFGAEVGLKGIIYTVFLLQLPFCIINGFLFISYTTILSKLTKENKTNSSYIVESIGSLFGGILVNFLLLWFFGILQSLLLLVAFNFVSISIFISIFRKPLLKVVLVIFFLGINLLFYMVEIYGKRIEWLFPEQKVVFEQTTPYGPAVVTEKDGQYNFYENGNFSFSSGNEILNEEAVHYPMVQHPNPKRILLVSGGLSGIIEEIQKYKPEKIDYFELNPAITMLGKRSLRSLRDPSVSVHNEDARNFIKKTKDKFDVALINLVGPNTLQLNRYYTVEFFEELRSKMNPGGIVSLQLPSTEDYVSQEAALLNSILVVSLHKSFQRIIVIPGAKNYLLASDSAFPVKFSELISAKNIPTVYINSYYLDENLLKDRSRFIMNHLDSLAPINTDFKPVGFYHSLNYWNSMFGIGFLPVWIILIGILLFAVFNLDRFTIGLFTSGFTGASLEIMVLLALQVMVGYLFSIAGIVFMLFIGGVAIGAWLIKKDVFKASNNLYFQFQILLAILTLLFPFIVYGIGEIEVPTWINVCLMSILTLLIALLTGAEFGVAARVGRMDVPTLSSRNYSMDLFGAAAGALITGVLLLPLLGMTGTCILLASLNLTSAFVWAIFDRKIKR